MKKILILIISSLAFFSCTKEEMYKYESCVPSQSSADDCFSVSFSDVDSGTKVTTVGMSLVWNSNDRISVFGSPVNRRYRFDGEDCSKTGHFVADDESTPDATFDRYYAFYPYDEGISAQDQGMFGTLIPEVQHYDGKYLNPSSLMFTAVSSGIDDKRLAFRSMFGVLKLSIACWYSQSDVSSITLSANAGEKLSGAATVKIDADGLPSLLFGNGASTSVTLDCGDGVSVYNGYADFYICLPPVTFDSGFTVTVTNEDGESFTQSTSRRLSIGRCSVTPMDGLWLAHHPVIGVTHEALKPNVMTSIIKAGGYPVKIPNIGNSIEGEYYLSRIDGLVAPGSANLITADRYTDTCMLRLSVAHKKWVMGLCFGCQQINKVFGGTLAAVSTKTDVNHYGATHNIDIVKTSHLHELVGGDVLKVNSRHKNCIDVLGDGLTIAAYSAEGIVEAIEGPYAIGTQFHPEDFAAKGQRPYLDLFEDFIRKVNSTIE